ncbi:hypothetical protein TVAG_182250 [Trichomonas vaginalis G3]|uniref:Uncharacterized protein n=2 Tax=Trichomonas vaginalis (strain ATCC PRA-98 / G3) TaxID=412133 RepID=A2D8W3_TRIV3|nr:hypothetical protein TVAG_182250 [Trichomonas vaginalis G3]|eukprot:XP_001583975.1 hypothetical protein [Trichomonas vaginalis G3]
MNRTKIVFIGADASVFHIFNTVYRNDDRFEILFFINPYTSSALNQNTKYPPNLAGPIYPQGIPILNLVKFQTMLTNYKVEKCIFSQLLVTSGSYLNFAAQCLAAGCQVISHNLDLTRLTPPKPLASYFSDSQFDYEILKKIIDVYTKSSKLIPIVAISGPLSGLSGEPFKRFNDAGNFVKSKLILDDHTRNICENLLQSSIPIIFIYDFDKFCQNAVRDNSFDMIIHLGFNSLPCFFKSHLQIYSCDDFTFPEDISHHSSSIIAEQSDLIIYAYLKSPDGINKFKHKIDSRKYTSLNVNFSVQSDVLLSSKPILLVDDPYPTRNCTAVRSISKGIAEQLHVQIYELPKTSDPNVIGSIFFEPTEKEWPALIPPESVDQLRIAQFADAMKKIDVDTVLSSAQRSLPPQALVGKKLAQVKFDVDTTPITEDFLELPASAFIKQRF